MTEHSTFLPGSPMRVRFDPVLDLLDELERMHGPALRVEIIDEAMRIYDELRPVMDRMMCHRGTAQIEAYGVIRRGEITFALLIKRDEMVVVDIELGSPPTPDPDGAGGWGVFKVTARSRERCIRVSGEIGQPTGMVTRPAQSTTSTSPGRNPEHVAAACAPPDVGVGSLSALSLPGIADGALRAQLRTALVAALDIRARAHLVTTMIGRGGRSSITVWIFDTSASCSSSGDTLNQTIHLPYEYGEHIREIFRSLIAKISNCRTSKNTIIDNKAYDDEDIYHSFGEINEWASMKRGATLKPNLVLGDDHLKMPGSCEAEYRRGLTEAVKLDADVADVSVWLVSVLDEPLRADEACGADHTFVSELRARFRLSAKAVNGAATAKKAREFAVVAIHRTFAASD